MKRTITYFAIIFLVFFCSKTIYAADIKEISVNTDVIDYLNSDNENYYSFKCNENGYYTVSLENADVTSKEDWTIVIYNEDMEAYSISLYHYFEKFNSCKLPYTKDSLRYIKIASGFNGNKGKFKLKVDFVATDTWEKENNNSQNNATELVMGKEMNGIVENYNAQDWFSIVTPNVNGVISFSLKNPNLDKNGELRMWIYDALGRLYYTGRGTNFASVQMGFKPNTQLYVCIGTYDSRMENSQYVLTPTFQQLASCEGENNNSANEANPITYGVKYYGTILGEDDCEDWYRLNNPSNGKVTLNFGPTDVSKKGFWVVEIYDTSGKSVKLLDTDVRKNIKFNLRKGVYYLKVTDRYGASQCEYSFSLTKSSKWISGKTDIKKVYTKKGYIGSKISKIKMKKIASNADGAKLIVSTKKNMKKPMYIFDIKLSKNISINKTILRKQYYVRIKPYIKDVFGKVYYASPSKVVKVK